MQTQGGRVGGWRVLPTSPSRPPASSSADTDADEAVATHDVAITLQPEALSRIARPGHQFTVTGHALVHPMGSAQRAHAHYVRIARVKHSEERSEDVRGAFGRAGPAVG